jgi:hypothetical protein
MLMNEPGTSTSSGFQLNTRSFGLFLAVVLGVLFWPVLSGKESFFYRDYGVLGYPFVWFQRECFWRGELPLWNPYSNCGQPFLAQWGTMTLYPGSLLYLLLPLPWSLGLFCLLHFWLAGMGMFRLLRHWKCPEIAAGLGGLLFVINGAAFSALSWSNYTVALAWMPWTVLLLERAVTTERKSACVPAAFAGAMQMLVGAPELAVFTWIAGGTLALAATARTVPALAGAALKIMLTSALVFALCAVQLLPFLDLLAASQRGGGAFSDTRWPMPPTGWANFFVPLFRSFYTPDGMLFQFGQEFLSSYYVPLIAW